MEFHQGSGGQMDPVFPFSFVQLSTFDKDSTTEDYPNIRWHQTADFGFVPNPRMKKTFMAVALDLPDESSPYGTIHPRDKQDVAHRLMLGARAVAYNQKDVLFLGPFPKEILLLPKLIIVHYDQEVSVTPSKNILQCSGSRWPEFPLGSCSHTQLGFSLNPDSHRFMSRLCRCWSLICMEGLAL